jgi:TolB-like protein
MSEGIDVAEGDGQVQATDAHSGTPDVFISYASQDAAIADATVSVLERRGLKCWIAPRDVTPGEFYAGAIVHAIDASKATVLILSQHSAASPHVIREVERAASKRHPLVSLRIDRAPLPAELEYFLNTSQWLDASTGTIATVLPQLAGAIRKILASPASAQAPPDESAPLPGIWRRLKENKLAQWTLAHPAFALIAVLLLIGGGLLWRYLRPIDERAMTNRPVAMEGSSVAAAPSIPDKSVAALPQPTAPPTAVAVMPFVNLTGDGSKDYLGDGMAEELINTLTNVPGLQVPARTSSFAYKGRNIDIRQVARDLNVGTVLEGSVRSAGDRIRVTAQLINAYSGLHIWSQTYERKFTDLFQLQDNLATAIVEVLRVKLNSGAAAFVTPALSTRDVQAYDLYMRGFAVLLHAASQENLQLALDLFEQALARDPTFARALAARSRTRLTFLVRGYPLMNARQDAERDARRALTLSPNLGVAHQALGNVSALLADWLQAEASYRAALAADATDPDIHSGYAMVVLAPTGHLRQARAEGARAYDLAPASLNHIRVVSQLDLFSGLDADAVKFADLAVELGGAPISLTQVYALTATRSAHYTAAAERAVGALSPTFRNAGGPDVVQLVYAALADPAKRPAALQALRTLVDKLGPRNIETGARRDLIVAWCMLDALDPAYELATLYLDDFERSGTGGGADWGVLWSPELRQFRRDPRFQRFVQRLNLFDYWKRYGPPDDCDLREDTLICR